MVAAVHAIEAAAGVAAVVIVIVVLMLLFVAAKGQVRTANTNQKARPKGSDE